MTDGELRKIILARYYDRRRDHGGWVRLKSNEFQPSISNNTILNISDQLRQKGLIEWNGIAGSLLGSGKISAAGIDEIEQSIVESNDNLQLSKRPQGRQATSKNERNVSTPLRKGLTLKTFFDTYTIVEQIGEGGTGRVFAAEAADGKRVAIKTLDAAKTTPERLKRFKNEYTFSSRNTHPNIIAVTDYGLIGEQIPFFVMPLYEGSLRRLIGKLTSDEAMSVVTSLLTGVNAAHSRKVTHRDLKPENVLVNAKGAKLVIADFGIAEFEQDEIYTAVETKEAARMANCRYAAPEQQTRGSRVDQRADISALGLMINELFTAKVPQGTNFLTIASVTTDYPYLDIIVEKMIAHDPGGRFETIEQIQREISARQERHLGNKKLSEIKGAAIPVDESSDPLLADPMKIVGRDYKDNTLTIYMNHQPNEVWVWAFQNLGSYSSLMGKGPDRFSWSGQSARINALPIEVQEIFEHFKEWLPRVNVKYAEKIASIRGEEVQKQTEALQQQIRQEEERLAVLQKLKF